uniref:Uncharacterized protein n=1 Tax=Panagrolaimus davidi TaxID=227884 RepID=A0A914R4S6_9BILA
MDYYLYNTIPGCLNATAESFNFMATVEDGSCISADKHFAFGGFYQNCTQLRSYSYTYDNLAVGDQCETLQISNPVTGKLSCPEGFTALTIHKNIYQFENRTITMNKRNCKFWFITYSCFRGETYPETITDEAMVETFWCKKEKPIQIAPTTPAPHTNALDDIMNVKILAALESSPDLLQMYFPYMYATTENPRFIGFSSLKNDPPSFGIRRDQIDKLSFYPAILKELIPKLSITKDKLINDSDAIENLARNPILLKNLDRSLRDELKEPEPPESKALFGGIFGEGHINIFTGKPECPLNFMEHKFLLDLKICIWNDTTEAWPISLGGIFDCNAKLLQCPRGFSRYVATFYDSCPVYYCVRMVNRKTFESPVINRPPFTSRQLAMEEIRAIS